MQWKYELSKLQRLVGDQEVVKLHVLREVQVHIDVVKLDCPQVIKILLALAAVVEDEVLKADVVRPPLHCI